MAEIMKRASLWMRYVEWHKLLCLFDIVCTNNGLLRPMELEKAGIAQNVLLVRGSNKPMTHTPRFHYRKVLENLGFIYIKDGKYFINANFLIDKLLFLRNVGEPLTPALRHVLGSIIMNNQDCRTYFFDVFSTASNYDYSSLQKKSLVAYARTSSLIPSHLKNRYNPIDLRGESKLIMIETPDKMHAIFWGVRQWAIDLNIIDEILIDRDEGRIIYVINYELSDLFIKKAFAEQIELSAGRGERWALLHIPSFIEKIVKMPNGRASVKQIKRVLIELLNKYPGLMSPVPVSEIMINLKIPFEKQDATYKKCYILSPRIGYISHIKASSTLSQELRNECGLL